MNDLKKLKLNTLASLFNQFIIVISGLVLPRFILTYYGSETNGLISSITEFLTIITFLELGVGSVVQSTLYKPIVEQDIKQINIILASARNFFDNFAKILGGYITIIIFILPLIIDSQFDYLGTSFLIFAMSLGVFSQYYFGIVNQLFLNSMQKNYIHQIIHFVTVILNASLSIMLIVNGFSIQIVRLVTGLLYLIKPFILNYYIKNRYDIDFNVKYSQDAIPQKWNGVAQHIAYTVVNSTDMIVLTLFSTLENVSVYSVHNMAINGVKLLISSAANGLKSFFGNLFAKGEIAELDNYFSKIEWLMHTIVTLLFALTATLLTSFVDIYTAGVNDANYNVPIFAIILSMAQMIYCIRLPYNALTLSAGYYRETQKSSVIEALLNVIISVLSVKNFGLIGIATGTLISLIYRTLYLVNFIEVNILVNRKFKFYKHFTLDLLLFFLMIYIGYVIPFTPTNFTEWLIFASVLGLIFSMLSFLINIIFYKKYVMLYVRRAPFIR